ncbi:MAG: TonB-dependent receptor [Gammaproteobacteria bacterium]
MNSRKHHGISWKPASGAAWMAGIASLNLLAAAPSTAAEADATALDVVIVTATKRPEPAREVAGSVTAVSSAQLEAIGAQSMADYITRVPGVVFNDYQPGNSPVVIRGLSTTTYQEQGQTVVGYYINEVSLSEPGFSLTIPDVDTFDLDHVEILRGPQGTLFGSSSLGGLINYVARPAKTDAYDAAVETSLNSTKNTGSAGYSAKGMVNVPLIQDKLAVRFVGLYRSDPGFIDNTASHVNGANDVTVKGGRASITWTPTDDTTVSWLSMIQKIHTDDGAYLIPGTLTRDTVLPEFLSTTVELHTARLDQKLPFATLTAVASYAKKEKSALFDDGVYFPGLYNGTTYPAPETGDSNSKNIELRLTSPTGDRFDWLVGAMYYKSEKSLLDTISTEGASDYIDAHPGDFGGPNLGDVLAPNDVFYRYATGLDGTERALFGEAALHFADAWTLTAGGRLFRTSSDARLVQSPGTLGVAFDFAQSSSEDGFAPKVSLAYKANDRFNFYGLVSKGFRFGGPNPVAPSPLYNTPLTYDTDSVINYEIGARTTWLDRRLELDATLFHVDWSDIQVRLFRPDGFAYVVNAGGSNNDGIEVSLAWRATQNFDIQSTATYLDAQLSEDLLQCQGCGGAAIPEGSTLPGSSKWSLANTASLKFDAPWHPRIVVTHRFISTAPVAFNSLSTQGGFHLFNARFAGTVGNVDLALYVNNIADKRGVLAGPFADFVPAVTIARPRTFGLTLDWKL